ncbi:PRC-barrel domain-containing protein [Acuticoccus yangtzensis]|uniref:PRC-barrel domain-containing protein n=1 Tax=Acuticoccus yangtzensis TaxID=1443441 RepID=UPI000949A635|nr:PRC-barrel domain-containing protein [Acuticoccus yangtzensis]
MHRNWFTGTALAALLAASPALAQTEQDATLCALSGDTMSQSSVEAMDADGNGEISRDELTRCLDANVAEDERQALLDEFDALDEDSDAVIVIADLDMGTATATTATATEVDVKQPEAEVAVNQPAPTVTVDQANPVVEVEQPEPEVAVTQREPEVQVSQPEPEVSVVQPEPAVEIQQDEAQVAVSQPEPRVEIDAPAPEVEVTQAQPNVTVEQHEPEVTVSQPEPEVNVETAEANVEVTSEEPKVVVEQGEPEVVIERVSGADPVVEQAEADSEGADAAAPIETAQAQMTEAPDRPAATTADTTAEAPAAMSATTATASALPLTELEGVDAVNSAGEKIGDVDEVVIENATGETYIVISVGGFLGIGDKDLAFPVSDVTMDGDVVRVATDLNEETLKDQESYDESRFTEIDD